MPEIGGDVEIGFEEEHADLMQPHLSAQQQNRLRDMFNVHADKKFEATGGANQEIGLNQFAIRKTVDVKRLKT